MAEGTRLRDINDHLTTLESRVQQLTMEYQGKVKELSSQIHEIREVGQRQYEALQAEATKKHEMVVLIDNSNRHEELFKLLSQQNLQF